MIANSPSAVATGNQLPSCGYEKHGDRSRHGIGRTATADGKLRLEAISYFRHIQYYWSSAVDGKLYLANVEGKISAVCAGGADWEVLRLDDVEELIAATPETADNALFVRTHSRLYCFRAR